MLQEPDLVPARKRRNAEPVRISCTSSNRTTSLHALGKQQAHGRCTYARPQVIDGLKRVTFTWAALARLADARPRSIGTEDEMARFKTAFLEVAEAARAG